MHNDTNRFSQRHEKMRRDVLDLPSQQLVVATVAVAVRLLDDERLVI